MGVAEDQPDNEQPDGDRKVNAHRHIARLAIFMMVTAIRWYQIVISPLLGANCRFTPTCSAYAIEAIRMYGPLRGGFRAAKRIGRCHPWNPGGYDPP